MLKTSGKTFTELRSLEVALRVKYFYSRNPIVGVN